MSPVPVSFEIKPLTHTKKDGTLYVRRTEVLQQIKELSLLPENVVFERIGIEKEKTPDSIKSETLAFLYRHSDDDDFRSLVFETLSIRIKWLVGQYRQWFVNSYGDYEDFVSDVNMEVLARINHPSDKGDYAQVSFGQWVVFLANNVFRKYEKADKIMKVSDSTDEEPNDPDERRRTHQVADRKIMVDRRMLIDEAIKSIKDPYHRQAYIAYHVDGYQIESKDDSLPTLAKIFNKTGRTVRNWLAQAERDIEAWKGGSK